MTLPGLVLVHGGQHAGDCWDLTVDEIHRLTPDLEVLALDHPGRRGKSGDLLGAPIDDWVESLLADIDNSGIGDFVIVGHSLAGLTVPGVVAELGPSRVKEMVLAAAFVPPQGCAVVDTLPGPIGRYTRRHAHKRVAGTLPFALADFVFCNGMTRDQRRFIRQRFYPESASIVFDTVDRSRLPGEVPRTWILTLRDRALSVASQRRSIAALGGVDTMLPMDTCHTLMVSEPTLLAEILVERCRQYG
jgi:hypothetical protein